MKKILTAASLALLPLAVHAQNLGGGELEKAKNVAGYRTNTIEGVIGTLITVVLSLVGVVFLVLTVYGGYLWMTARGDEGKVEKAKDTISRSIIGLIIVLAAYAITYFVVGKLIIATVK